MSNKKVAREVLNALEDFNRNHNRSWDFGSNWNNVSSEFETFVNKYLFPKISETNLINIALGNRFNFLAKEIDFISQYSEEYVFMDSIPINMNLSKNSELMLKRNYPNIASKLYGQGVLKKLKFTLNNNDVRLNFNTLSDAISYALGVYKKRISDINVLEEREIKAMLVKYSLEYTQDKREVTSPQDLFSNVFNAILNIQNNSTRYNECNTASGGAIGQYTTTTALSDVCILTNDEMKTYLLDTKLANTFQVSGIDLSSRIISFDDLGGNYEVLEDIKLSDDETLQHLKNFGDYQSELGDLIPKGSIFTYDISQLKDFKGKVKEIKPKSELYAYIFDINKLRYKRCTENMLKIPFYNPEFDEVTYWLHYYSMKQVSPFYNNVSVIGG